MTTPDAGVCVCGGRVFRNDGAVSRQWHLAHVAPCGDKLAHHYCQWHHCKCVRPLFLVWYGRWELNMVICSACEDRRCALICQRGKVDPNAWMQRRFSCTVLVAVPNPWEDISGWMLTAEWSSYGMDQLYTFLVPGDNLPCI